MNVSITGGSGFIGTRLASYFLEKGNHVTAIGTRSGRKGIHHDRFTYIRADTTEAGDWQKAIAGADVVINLAGRSIFSRWTDRTKRRIYDSRILTTRNLVSGLSGQRDVVLCSTSGSGYYGDRGDEILDERAASGSGFLAELCRDWEEEALGASERGVRVVVARFGIVLDGHGGALNAMIPPFRSFVGGPLGDGRQWFPWIHMADLVSAIAFAVGERGIAGSTNFCAPNPVRNREYAKALGAVLSRPSSLSIPSWVIRIVLGEFGGLLLSSQRMIPDRLMSSGYAFRYPDIGSALADIMGADGGPRQPEPRASGT